MSALTISHTAGEGTLALGTAKGDGSAPILTSWGLRWSRTIGTAGAWYLPRSRDRDPHTDCINGVAGALRQAGFTAEIAIDTTPRATAAVEADRAQRSATRAHRLTERSARLIHQGTDEWARARELANHLPLGQPDLVDHHSYPRTRRFRERIHRMQDRAIGNLTAGERAGQAAEAAHANQRHHLNGATTERRIQRLEAHARDLARKISRAQASNDTEARAGLEPRAARSPAISPTGRPTWQT